MILSIDPSFKGFAFAVTDNDAMDVIYTKKLSSSVEDVKHVITDIHLACFEVLEFFQKELEFLKKEHCINFFEYTIVEYPAFQTTSGSRLAVLNGMLASYLRKPEFGMVYWVPPGACDAYIHNKDHTKSFIVNWAKEHFSISKRISNDECTCLVFSRIMSEINHGLYKKSYFKISDEYDSSKYNWLP